MNIGQITAAFHSPGTTAVARELLNKPAKEVVLEGGGQPLEQYKVQLFMAWALCFVMCGEPVMDKARSNYGNAHQHRWNWQCWDSLPVVSAEDGIVEFVVEICMHFGSFDNNTQVRLQGNNLSMGKEQLRIGC